MPVPITLETVFCDYEQDAHVIETYFDRLKQLLRSVSEQMNSEGWQLFHLLYVSRDKADFIEKLRAEIDMDRTDRQTLIVEYDHPPGGYGTTSANHVDQIKNPNRSASRRKALFEAALKQIGPILENAPQVLRTAVDDDDFFLPHHMDQIVRLSRLKNEETFAFGIDSAFIAYCGNEGVLLQEALMNVAAIGNKVMVVGRGSDISDLSPFSIPDRIDTYSKFQFEHNFGLTLTGFDVPDPSWTYMRRETNLSKFDKSHFVDTVRNSWEFGSEAEMIRFLVQFEARRGEIREHILDAKLSIHADYVGSTIRARSNFSFVGQTGDQIAFLLYRNREKIRSTPYSSKTADIVFEDVSEAGDYQVKAFVRRTDGSRISALSRHIFVS